MKWRIKNADVTSVSYETLVSVGKEDKKIVNKAIIESMAEILKRWKLKSAFKNGKDKKLPLKEAVWR